MRRRALSTGVVLLALRGLFRTAPLLLPRSAPVSARTGGDDQVSVIAVIDCPDAALECLRHFRSLQADEHIWFAASARDQRGTQEALSRAGANVITAPAELLSKAGQLNWAKRRISGHYRWVSLYDVDSRPVSLVEPLLMSSPPPDVVARRSLYRAPAGNRLLDGVALAQTFWSFTYEAATWRFGRSWYLVGHGTTLSREVFESVPFDEDAVAEDIALGYRLSAAGHEVQLSDAVDVAYVPGNLQDLYRQARRWFYGDMSATRWLAQPRRFHRRFSLAMDWALLPVVKWSLAARCPRLLPLFVVRAAVGALLADRVRRSQEFADEAISLPHAALGFELRSLVFAVAAISEAVAYVLRGPRPGGFEPTPLSHPDHQRRCEQGLP
jgi:hypothetical protein